MKRVLVIGMMFAALSVAAQAQEAAQVIAKKDLKQFDELQDRFAALTKESSLHQRELARIGEEQLALQAKWSALVESVCRGLRMPGCQVNVATGIAAPAPPPPPTPPPSPSPAEKPAEIEKK